MERKLTKEQIAEFREAFDAIDKNSDGMITSSELGDAMRALGQKPTAAELKMMIDKVDRDGNGKIDFQEFLAMMERQKRPRNKEEELRDAFMMVVKDGSSLISRDELCQLMVNLGETVTNEEVDEMIREVDLDGNGEIDADEFIKIMMSK